MLQAVSYFARKLLWIMSDTSTGLGMVGTTYALIIGGKAVLFTFMTK